jgi:hypothetical protein
VGATFPAPQRAAASVAIAAGASTSPN